MLAMRAREYLSNGRRESDTWRVGAHEVMFRK
jgi:hypothetical protein